ncbi:MAG TPA: CBS domain-containing protein [Nitrosopumilaceae archaeon]|jgi:CBS domain-containing protein|nr:CBS domain-containing protein [Nitrosopumilaceae archaeon]
MRSVKDIMKKPIVIDQSSSFSHAMHKFLKHKISRLLTTNNDGKIIGIITEKDIGDFLLSNNTEKNLDDILISEISHPLIEVSESTPIEDAAHIMYSKNIGSVGVSSFDTTGIVTKTDLVRYYIQHYVGHKRVGDAMTVSYSAMYQDDKLYKILEKMIQDKVSRLIIKDNEDNAVGVISFGDVFRISLTMGQESDVVDNSDPAISVIFPRKGFLSATGFGGTSSAKDVMSDSVISVDYNDDLVTVCTEMIDNNINGCGVLINGKLSGIVSKTDITAVLAGLRNQTNSF